MQPNLQTFTVPQGDDYYYFFLAGAETCNYFSTLALVLTQYWNFCVFFFYFLCFILKIPRGAPASLAFDTALRLLPLQFQSVIPESGEPVVGRPACQPAQHIYLS